MKTLWILLLSITLAGCTKQVDSFDFTPFKEKGWVGENSKKYLTFIRFNPSKPGYLFFSCDLEYNKLKPYFNSPNLDILFLIKTNVKDTAVLNKYLASDRWCYEKYIVTFKEPDLFRRDIGISYLFDKNGKIIALTNPSLKNFKKLVEE
ncbi:MAG: hypothetical protein PHT92_12595 [Bacteroidales bacterium]|jgi:hypothetical protein|nr:hypothetical protein [Bacteroidales bacterium]